MNGDLMGTIAAFILFVCPVLVGVAALCWIVFKETFGGGK